jgi:hypothetical protein
MIRTDATPAELLDLAHGLLENSGPATAGLWPRASALLARQALELALAHFWANRAPGVESSSIRAQLICLREYLDEEKLAERTSHIWWMLTRAVHHHPYELAPTGQELEAWLEEVGAVIHGLTSAPE